MARIGITIGLQHPNESLWVNGIKQTALALADVLRHLPEAHEVCLLNTTAVPLEAGLPWSQATYPTYALSDYSSKLDVLIVLGGAVESRRLAAFKQQGTKLIAYKCGSEYIASMQASLYGAELAGQAHYPTEFDALWLLPQIAELNGGFYETLHRCSAQIVPFVWNPALLEAACASLPHGGCYRPSGNVAKRLSCCEPNRDVLKFGLYPLLIAERAYRQAPERIAHFSMTNTQALRDNAEFASVVGHLDLVRAGQCYFEDTYPNYWFLAQHTDVLISHQWGNPLNYAYLEAAWLGYPLLHNASLCQGLGYYYPAQAVEVAAQRLQHILAEHDHAWQDYAQRQRAVIQGYLSSSPSVQAHYAALLHAVLNKAQP